MDNVWFDPSAAATAATERMSATANFRIWRIVGELIATETNKKKR
jgi:hypothetical protein